MTLDEAVREAKTAAMIYRKEAHNCIQHGGSFYEEKARVFKEAVEENEQIAEWLEELKAYRETYPYGVEGYPPIVEQTKREGE